MANQPFLSVIIPSYNEISNLKRSVLNDVINYLKTRPYSWEVILSDDGSNDGTLEQLNAFANQHAEVRVLANPPSGGKDQLFPLAYFQLRVNGVCLPILINQHP